MIEGIAFFSLSAVYEFIKFWLPLGGVTLGAYKAANYIKEKVHILDSIPNHVDALKFAVNDQTKKIVAELQEQRQEQRNDIRTMYASLSQSTATTRAAPKRTRKKTTQSVQPKEFKEEFNEPLDN